MVKGNPPLLWYMGSATGKGTSQLIGLSTMERESHSSLHAHRSALQGTPACGMTEIIGSHESVYTHNNKQQKGRRCHTPNMFGTVNMEKVS